MLNLDGYNITFGAFEGGSRFSVTFEAMDLWARLDVEGFRDGPGGARVTGWWTLDAGASELKGESVGLKG